MFVLRTGFHVSYQSFDTTGNNHPLDPEIIFTSHYVLYTEGSVAVYVHINVSVRSCVNEKRPRRARYTEKIRVLFVDDSVVASVHTSVKCERQSS